jgi:hypothetical protein
MKPEHITKPKDPLVGWRNDCALLHALQFHNKNSKIFFCRGIYYLASVRADCVRVSLICSQGGGNMCSLEFPGNTGGRKFTNLSFL